MMRIRGNQHTSTPAQTAHVAHTTPLPVTFAYPRSPLPMRYEPLVRLLGLRRTVQSPFWAPYVQQPCRL